MEFNLKTRKAKQPGHDLSLKMVILPPGNLKMKLNTVSSHLILGFQGVLHYSLVWLLGLKVCVVVATGIKDVCRCGYWD